MDEEKRKRFLVYGLILCLGLGAVYVFSHPEGFEGLLGGSGGSGDTQTATGAHTHAGTEMALGPNDENEHLADREGPWDSQADGDAEAIQPLTLAEAKNGDLPHARDKIVDALETLERWKKSIEETDIERLDQYLFHEKLWVRLGALETALEQEIYSAQQLLEIGQDIRSQFNVGQILRYLERARHSNESLYLNLQKALGFKDTPAEEDSAT